MHVSWTALELAEPSSTCPWTPSDAVWWQAGQAGAGRVEIPSFAGRWWSVLAVWDEPEHAAAAAAGLPDAAWHVVLEPVAYRGDAVLSGGAQPFDALPPRGKVAGAAAVITLAGLGADGHRTREFFEHVTARGADVEQAAGHRAALVQAPEDGAVLTFSAWRTLRDAVTWAYHRPEHASTVRRQEEHGLVAASGFLRCAVVASSGRLRGADPLAGLTGTPVRMEAA